MPTPINLSASRGAAILGLSKKCTKCGEVKPLSEFNYRKESSDNLTSWCRNCLSDKNKKWAIDNRKYLHDKRKNQRLENPEKFRTKFKKWYYENHDQQLQKAMEFRKNNPRKVRDANRKSCAKRIKIDFNYKLLIILRNRINNVVRRANGQKAYKTIELISCSIPQLKQHLESQFKPGMTFENHGTWHIDHIKPCASFDLTDPEQQKICFHYMNLQPLWAIDNIKKGAKIA